MKHSLAGYHQWNHLVGNIPDYLWQISTLILALINLNFFLTSIIHDRLLDISPYLHISNINLIMPKLLKFKEIKSCLANFFSNYVIILLNYTAVCKPGSFVCCYTWYLGNFKHKQDGHSNAALVGNNVSPDLSRQVQLVQVLFLMLILRDSY